MKRFECIYVIECFYFHPQQQQKNIPLYEGGAGEEPLDYKGGGLSGKYKGQYRLVIMIHPSPPLGLWYQFLK